MRQLGEPGAPMMSRSSLHSRRRVAPREWALAWVLVAGMALVPAPRASAEPGLPALDPAQWIWAEETASTCELRKVFTLDAPPASAVILVTADNGYELSVNGSLVGREVGAASEIWQSVERYDVTSRLAKGRNIIGIQGLDLGGVRGVVAALRLEWTNRPALELQTDATWRAARRGRAADYSHPEFVEGPEWSDARVIGPMGVAPWGRVAFGDRGRAARSRPAEPRNDLIKPGPEFAWPSTVAFLADDCSVYVPERGDAWGVCFRVGDWSRAYTEFDLPCPAKIGRTLCVLNPGPAAAPRVLLAAGAGVIGSPSATFDGQALLVSAALGGDKFFHIYRVPVAGGSPRRLTDGPFHDLDPAELPDGRIVFASTRIGTFEEYHQPPSRALFRMNADGSGIHPITSTLIFDNEPRVMADGRIAFIRSDNFFDRGKVETHLHITRPDGTDGFAEIAADVGPDYGVRLRAYGYGSPAPLPDGRLAFISSRGNFIASVGAPERVFQRLPDRLGDVSPLPDGRLLCTVLAADGRHPNSAVLGVIDPRDSRRVVRLHESATGPIHSPVFVGARSRPPVIPDYVDSTRAGQPGATGFLFCQDARFTTKARAGWENVRAIRVLGAVPLTVRSSHSHIVHVGHETVELGTVPLLPDGSFYLEVPADMPLALQAVDAEGRSELNEMSWMYVRPGERRSCLGCHHPRQAAPPVARMSAAALRAPPVALLGQGQPHRSRGNNAGVTGLMDLQFERFRECASLNRHALRDQAEATGADEIAALLGQLAGPDDGLKISAAQRLAIFRETKAAPALAAALQSPRREVRLAAAVALGPCGTREVVTPLLDTLEDRDPIVRQAAAVALENLTGHRDPDPSPAGPASGGAWRGWMRTNTWETMEQRLLEQLKDPVEATRRRAIVALGHTGGGRARTALRRFVAETVRTNPYPVFVRDNRTDTFTYSSESPWNPRTLQEAVRALGRLRDSDAVAMLEGLLAVHTEPERGNLYFAEGAIEALGRIGTPAAEQALLATFRGLKDYWHYVGWYSDHPALYACHSSPVHARVIEALDRLGSTRAADLVPALVRSVPTDPDRGLFLDNDDYEILVGRLLRRSGRGDAVTETCLAILGDASAKSDPAMRSAVAVTHPAWAGHPGPENRAAQILSLACRDRSAAPRVRAAFARYRDRAEEPVERALGNPTWTPVRHWVLFYLARTLGQLHDGEAVGMLASVLADELNEARHGRPDPAEPMIHLLQLEYTPCWRAAAAWALGRIGDARAMPALLGAVRNLDNAPDVRHAAAVALGRASDPARRGEIRSLAADYPEVSTRRALWRATEHGGL